MSMSTSPLPNKRNLGKIPHLSLAPTGDPLKGILKRPEPQQPPPQEKPAASSHRPTISVPSFAFLSSRFKAAPVEAAPVVELPVVDPRQATDAMTSGVVKPSVGFSNRDAVAIIGDTSDDLTTEAENSERLWSKTFPTTARRRTPAAIVSPIRKVSLTETVTSTPTESVATASAANGVENGEESTEDDGDTVSMQSSTSAAPSDGVSGSNLERWWTGKSTKFVLHCDRHGCNHRHSPPKGRDGSEELRLNANGERYETPTQRKNKEVARLTKELRRCHRELHEKERHLSELRSRLGEIESMIDEGRLFGENSRLMQRLREREDEFRKERRILADRHDIRQRQLIQETVDARTEATRKTMQMEKLSAQLDVAKIDVATMTTPESDAEGGESDASPAVPLQPQFSSSGHLGSSVSAPASPSTVDKQRMHQHQVAALTQETMTQLEAYRNEALIWRTKSAQLEIVVKELLLTSETEARKYTAHLNARSDEVNELKETVRRLSVIPASAVDNSNQQGVDGSSLKAEAPAECQLSSCTERKRMLIDENKKLLEQMREKTDGIEQLERDLDELEGEHAKSKSELDELRSTHAELGRLAEKREAECVAAQMTLDRLEVEKDTMKKAISYLEARHQVYQNVILDNNLHVHDDESTEEWRRGFADSRFSVYLTKGVQTALTLNELNVNEKELAGLQIKLREVEMEFSRDSAAMHDKFGEIERNLVLKTRLVEHLSGQLEQSAKAAQLSDEQKQNEREIYQTRIDELAKVAERVPILENEMERAREAKSQLEISFRKTTEAFDDHLGDSFKQSLKRQQDLEDYWRQRAQNIDEARMKAVAYGEILEKGMEELRLRHSIERTELDRRLVSAIAHVELLNAKINFPRKDAASEARPKTANKYVGCKPNQRHKSTAILRGDIPDVELNMYKADLLLAKRKIEDLEAKLRRHAPQTLLQVESSRAGSVEHTFGRAYYFKNRDSGTVQLVMGDKAPAEDDEISVASSPGGENVGEATRQRRQGSVSASPLKAEKEDWKRLHLEVVVKRLKEANKRHIHDKFVLGEKVHQLEGELSEVRREELIAKLYGGKPATGIAGPRGAAAARRRANSLFVAPREQQQTPALETRIAPIRRLQIARYRLDGMKWKGGEDGGCPPEELYAICAELEDVLSHEERRVAAGVPVERFMELKGENDLLLDQLARVKEALERAELELSIYRREPREEAKVRQGDVRLQRSRSLVELDAVSATPQELRRWKETGGALFREVNRLRIALDGCYTQRDEYKRELLMLKGELVLAKCQAILEEERAIRSSRWRYRRNSQPGVRWLDELESVVPTQARRVSMSPRRSPLISTGGADLPVQLHGSHDSMPASDNVHGSGSVLRVGRRRSQGGFQSPMEKELRIVREALHRQTAALRDKNRELEGRVEQLEGHKRIGTVAIEGGEPKNAKRLERLEGQVAALECENGMLRTENSLYEKKVREIEEDQAKMYLIMFRKGQQAANADIKEDIDAMTEQRVMLRFLHDAFYYYLLNRGSSREHLQAIMTMLDFTSEQKEEVYRRRGASH